MKPEIYNFDIDGTLAITKHTDYEKSKPNKLVIQKINALFDSGHYIKISTSRGVQTGKDWRDLTEKQLAEWGVKYNELIMGKPFCDHYIADEAVSIKEFMRLTK